MLAHEITCPSSQKAVIPPLVYFIRILAFLVCCRQTFYLLHEIHTYTDTAWNIPGTGLGIFHLGVIFHLENEVFEIRRQFCQHQTPFVSCHENTCRVTLMRSGNTSLLPQLPSRVCWSRSGFRHCESGKQTSTVLQITASNMQRSYKAALSSPQTWRSYCFFANDILQKGSS